MAELTGGQRGLIGGLAVGIALLAVVLLVLRTTGHLALPPYIPILLLVSAIGLMLGSRGRKAV